MTTPRFLRRLARLGRDQSGLALLEFAFILPIFLTLGLTGAEITNFIITRMRISQIALHLADNSARIGSGSLLQAKKITETDINDLLTGAQLQSGEMDLKKNGRVIVTEIRPTASGATTYKVGWQRCFGDKTAYVAQYPRAGQSKTSMTGIGPVGREAIAPDDGATMFVEVYYEYKPLIQTALSPDTKMTEIASMMVRDRRDQTGGTASDGIYNTENATKASC